MQQKERIEKLLELRKKFLNSKEEAVKSMNDGDLKAYFQKLTASSNLKKEFSEALNAKA